MDSNQTSVLNSVENMWRNRQQHGAPTLPLYGIQALQETQLSNNDHPDLNGKYQYSKLGQPKEYIRLVRIEPGQKEDPINCSLIRISLGAAARSFEALSYTWGDAIVKEEIRVGSQDAKLEVTKNCLAALQHLRYPDRPVLAWIDAICINQDDIEERNAQVSIMQRIYALAQQVVIFLGEATEDSDLIMDFFSVFQVRSGLLAWMDNDAGEKFKMGWDEKQALMRLFEHPWFTRVWILQEVYSCSFDAAILVCGDRWISWHMLNHLEKIMGKRREYLKTLPWGDYEAAITWPYVVRIKSLSYKARRDLLSIICETRDFGSTDPRDKVFALLSLFDDSAHEGLVADYTLSTNEVYKNVAKYLVRGGLDFLSATQNPSSIAGLTSWVPDWSQRRKAKELTRLHSFNAGGDKSRTQAVVLDSTLGNPWILKVEGFVLGAVDDNIIEFTTCSRSTWDKYPAEFLENWLVFGCLLESQKMKFDQVVFTDPVEKLVARKTPLLYAMTKVFSHQYGILLGDCSTMVALPTMST